MQCLISCEDFTYFCLVCWMKMHGWTPLIMAAKGGYTDVVNLLLSENPNVNAVDQDGRSALAWSAKEGYNEIVIKLLQKGAFMNMPDRNGDSPLILAAKEGHSGIVRTLVASYADIEMVDGEGKTPLYVAVEKGHVGVVSELLSAGANTETTNKDGETPLLRGAKKKHTQCVKLLIEKGANINAIDKKGDNLLHVIVRNKYVGMCELLVNESKYTKLLQQVNKAGETPYSIDSKNKPSVLAEICPEGQYNQSFEKMDLTTQQDILLSSLGKYLVEPSLSIPMTVGMYSRWGSGKSVYIRRLVELLQEYKDHVPFRPFTITVLLVVACFACSINFGIVVWAIAGNWIAGAVSGIILVLTFLLLCMFGRFAISSASRRLRNCGVALANIFHHFMLMLKLMYCVPPSIEDFRPVLPVHLVMVDLSQSIFVANSPMTSLVSFTSELNDAIERDLGLFIPRLYRVFRTAPYRNRSGNDIDFHVRCKLTCCCLPSFVITLFIFLCLLIGIILYRIHGVTGSSTVIAIQIACCCVFGGGLIAIIIRCFVMIYCLCLPMKKRVKIVSNQDGIPEETFLSVLKQELDLYVDMLECLDGFNRRQTRIIIYIDLVDSLEQQKVLSLINTINLLVTEPGHPFILVLSVDPRLLIKAVDQTLSNMQGPVISPCEYLKNMVDLPFYMNEYPKLQADGVIPTELYNQLEEKLELSENEEPYEENEWADNDEIFSGPSHVIDMENGHVPLGNGDMSTVLVPHRTIRFSSNESVTSTDHLVTNTQEEQLSEDISHLLKNNENNTINDVRRIMNIVSLNGRLLLFNDVPFQWTRLAIWVSLCDGWPYKASWITLLCLDTLLNLPGNMSIRRLHGLFGYLMPTIGDKNLGTENSASYFDTFIASHKPPVNVNDARFFAAFMFYIDPTIRKLMLDYILSMKTMTLNQPSVQQHVSITSNFATTTNRNDEFLWKNSVTPEVLIRMTVDDIASQLLDIEGLEESLLSDYKNRLIDNNVNGRVLMACDLNELRDAMQMKFGDWQLFKGWICASRNKEQRPMKRCEEKLSTDRSTSCYNSCVDGSQSESNPGTPKPSACGSSTQNHYHLPLLSEKHDKISVPYASHSPQQALRKSYTKPTKSVSQDSENSSPQHITDLKLHHSSDSGFASAEVDQNNRLMLSWQRQTCAGEPTESNGTFNVSNTNKNNVQLTELTEINSNDNLTSESKDSSKHSETVDDTLISADIDIHVSSDVNMNSKIGTLVDIDDVGDSKKKVDHDGDANDASTTINIRPPETERPRPPSLSEVPLPPLSMLDELVHWPMNPPAEFDDHDSESLPSPPCKHDQVNLVFTKSDANSAGPTIGNSEDEIVHHSPLLAPHVECEIERNFLLQSASTDFSEKRSSLEFSRSVPEIEYMGGEAESKF